MQFAPVTSTPRWLASPSAACVKRSRRAALSDAGVFSVPTGGTILVSLVTPFHSLCCIIRNVRLLVSPSDRMVEALKLAWGAHALPFSLLLTYQK